MRKGTALIQQCNSYRSNSFANFGGTVRAPLGNPKSRESQSESEYDSSRWLRSMCHFARVQAVDPEIGCVVDEPAIFGS